MVPTFCFISCTRHILPHCYSTAAAAAVVDSPLDRAAAAAAVTEERPPIWDKQSVCFRSGFRRCKTNQSTRANQRHCGGVPGKWWSEMQKMSSKDHHIYSEFDFGQLNGHRGVVVVEEDFKSQCSPSPIDLWTT